MDPPARQQTPPPPKRDNHTPSCAVCQRRKVKCDRVNPCSACTKSKLDCSFPPPRHGKRARRNTLHQYSTQEPYSIDNLSDTPNSKQAIRNSSLPTQDFPSPESTHSSGTTTARLVSDGVGYRCVSNHLWNALDTDNQAGLRCPTDGPTHQAPDTASRSGYAVYEDAVKFGDDMFSSRSFIFGNGGPCETSPLAGNLQIPAAHTVFLWHKYLADVDPVMKISHAPTVQHILLNQIGRPNIPRNEQALISAIYFISTLSLTDEACRESLQEAKVTLLHKLRYMTKSALEAAGYFTTTDTMVLQAFILYLTALRSLGEIQLVWSLLGTVTRISGMIGLHKDGTSLSLPPFETEMRRRLWWGIVYLDGRMAEILGQDNDLMGNDYEASPPSNLNDSDLFPSMSRLPESRKGPTEAIYMQARVLSISVARSLQSITGPQSTWHRLYDSKLSTLEKLDIMRRIDARYNEEILGPCDPTVPLQWLSINTARTFATKLRLIARIPIVDLEGEWENADGFSENAFRLSMQLLQLQVDLWCEPMVQQWRWHWQMHFQWYALATLLRQTRLRRGGPGISPAWTLIQQAFQIIIPTVELGPKKSILLEGIHALLNAAKRQQDYDSLVESEHKPRIHAGDIITSPSYDPMIGPSSGFGPHTHASSSSSTTMIPVMDVSQIPTPTSFGAGDAFIGYNLEAIDWTEFDRLASELCQQRET